MKFLLDANMPRSAGDVLRGLGHEAVDVRDALPPGADDATVASLARNHRLVLITRDFDFADIRNYPPEAYAGIVVLELPEDAIASRVIEVCKSFVTNEDLLRRLKGRLAIVESWRVRFRPAEPSE